MVLILKLSFFFRFVVALASHFSLTLVKNISRKVVSIPFDFIKVFIWQLTYYVKQRCLAVVFKCAQKYSCSTLLRVSMGLTVRRKTAKNLAVRRKNERILAVSRKKN